MTAGAERTRDRLRAPAPRPARPADSGARLYVRAALRHPLAMLAAGWALLLLAWAVSNPPFAAPDEPAHYVRAVDVGGGQVAGRFVVEMPAGLWAEWTHPGGTTCNSGQPTVPAACLSGAQPTTAPVEVTTAAGGYPPAYYVLPGLAARLADDPYTALRLARLTTAVLTLALLLLAAALLLSSSAPALSLVGLVAAVTPMVLFIGSSVSSSALEIAAGIAFFAALLRLARGHPRPRWVWASAIATGLALPATRTTGFLWIALDLALVALLAWGGKLGSLQRDLRRPLAALAFVAAAGILFNRLWEASYGSTITQRGVLDYGDAGGRLVHGIQQLRRLLDEQVGVFGWLDATMPPVAYPAWQTLVAALLGGAVLMAARRELVALAAAIAAWATTSVLLSASLVAATLQDVQGRHMLAFAAVVPLLAGEVLFRNRGRLSLASPRALVGAVALGAAAIHVTAWWSNGRRQAVGQDGPWVYFDESLWNPPLGWWTWALVATLGAALAAAAVLRLAAER